MTRPDHEIDAYLEGTLTAEQARAIDTWIAAAPANAAAFLHLVRTHQMLSIVGKENKLAREASQIKPDAIDHVTLASLVAMEAAADPATFCEIKQPFAFEPARKRQERSDTTLPQALDDLRWAAGKVAARLIRSKPVITGVIAAMLLIGLYLFGPFATSNEPTPAEEVAVSPDETIAPPQSTTVATLTDTHNATWAERALARGSSLHAGDRLTLTAGFAEITTVSGAVAILEAPASVELIDSPNALRLRAGKLVGICETQASKGFLVRTPHIDVTDLGTRFGVEVNEEAMTEVHVIQGSVQVSSSAQEQDPQRKSHRLTSGCAVLASADDLRIRSTTYQPNRFPATGLSVTALAGTGLGLKPDEVDANWQIVAIDGSRLDQPQALRVNKLHRQYAKLYPNDPATSQWLSWEPPGLPIGQRDRVATAYHFQTRVELPASFNASTDRVIARCMADDRLQSIAANGQAVEVPDQKAKDDPDAWFKESYEIVIDHQLVAGQNTIDFVLLNGHAYKDRVGLRIAWELQTHVGTLAPEAGQ